MATIPSARKLENSIFSQKSEYTPGSVGFAYATRRVRRERRVSQNPEVCGSGAPTRERPNVTICEPKDSVGIFFEKWHRIASFARKMTKIAMLARKTL